MADDCECDPCPDCPPGIPAWVMTFADLMSLLMCFFVLLLSFSEMDALKFKRLAGEMAEAFGVQNIVDVTDIPKGVSVIAEEFLPGKVEPTPIEEVRQLTADIPEPSLKVNCEDYNEGGLGKEAGAAAKSVAKKDKNLDGEVENQAAEIAKKLQDQLNSGQLELETRDQRIIIRIKEKGAFDSGEAEISERFLPIMERLKNVLLDVAGNIVVEGHTDNLPVQGGRYASNFALSVARAVAVAHELFYDSYLDQRRFAVTGLGDTQPIENNETPAGRARNRRVEIIIRRTVDGADILPGQGDRLPDQYRSLERSRKPQYRLRPDEIF